MPEPVNSPPRPEPFRWNAVCVLEGPHIPFSTEQRWRNQNRRWEFATQKVFNHNATGSEWILEQSSQLKCAFCERCSGLNSDSQQAGWEGPQELSFCKLDLSGEPLSWMSVGSAPPPSPSLILTLMYRVSRGFAFLIVSLPPVGSWLSFCFGKHRHHLKKTKKKSKKQTL